MIFPFILFVYYNIRVAPPPSSLPLIIRTPSYYMGKKTSAFIIYIYVYRYIILLYDECNHNEKCALNEVIIYDIHVYNKPTRKNICGGLPTNDTDDIIYIIRSYSRYIESRARDYRVLHQSGAVTRFD